MMEKPKIKEILDLLKEECAELIVAASKTTRWGAGSTWEGKSNLENLTQEVGDVMALVGLLVDAELLDMEEIEAARAAKIEKLKKWTTVFSDAP